MIPVIQKGVDVLLKIQIIKVTLLLIIIIFQAYYMWM